MKKMKRNVFLIPFITAIALLMVGFVAAAEIADYSGLDVEFNGIGLSAISSAQQISGVVGDVIPIRVIFTADQNLSDVKVKVSMEGSSDDVSTSTAKFDIIEGVIYSKLLNLELPVESDDLTEEFTLYVEIVSSSDQTEEEYTILIQRNSYELSVLSVDYSSKVSAGEVFPVAIVVKNEGYNRLDDVYVSVSLPELGISTQGYLGDLIPVEDYNVFDDSEEDSAYKTVYLKVPTEALSGVYDLVVKVYNDDKDASKTVTKTISVGDSVALEVLAGVKNKEINAGETATYELILVNSANSVKVFNLEAIFGGVLDVSVPSVVTVGADSSETVSIKVSVDEDAKEGSYAFSVGVDGDAVVFGANVTGREVSGSFVALTVILAIIFVVLLAVLIVLLARKEKPADEVETSYY